MPRLGAAGWQEKLNTARAEFVERLLAWASVRSLPAAVRMRDFDGRTQDLRSLAKGRVSAVVFWSRFCGPAVEALPRVKVVAAQVADAGVRAVGVVEERAPSRELATFLREHDVTPPTSLDAWHERAARSVGDAHYYVLDADGRTPFDATTSPDEWLALAEVLRLGDAAARDGARSAGSAAVPATDS